jgi:hypothetical protein
MKKKTNSKTLQSNQSPLQREWRDILLAARAHPLPPRELQELSAALPENREHDGHLLVSRFMPYDVIWVGSSNRTAHGRLVDVSEFLRLKPGRDAYIVPNAFRSIVTTVGRDTPVNRRFLTLSTSRESMAVQERLPLVAIVAASPQRLEGWYQWRPEWDAPEVYEALEERLAGLGFGARCLRPLRVRHLPGVVHPQTNFTQSLLFISSDK